MIDCLDRWARGWVLLVLGAGVLLNGCNDVGSESPEPGPAPTVDRRVAADLETRIESIQSDMPREGSNGFVQPSTGDLEHWRTLIESLIDDDTTEVRSLIDDHFPSYALIHFTDTTTGHTYRLVQEAPSVEVGWGTVVVNAAPERNVAVEVPHPSFDLETHREGANLFRKTGARVLIVAGTHRCANRAASSCSGTTGVCGADGPYRQSDMAHVIDAPFQVTHEAFVDRYPRITAFSLHGNGQDRCETVFLSSGVEDDTPQPVRDLRQALLERGVRASVPGTSSCPLVGSTNVQGRYTNGSPEPCRQAASSATGTFIHVEQKLDFRQSEANYGALIDAVKATFD